MPAGAQPVPYAVTAPGALPGAVHENECLWVCHAVKSAEMTMPRSSRRVVILPRAASAVAQLSSRSPVIFGPARLARNAAFSWLPPNLCEALDGSGLAGRQARLVEVLAGQLAAAADAELAVGVS